ncbi:asparagine synthetase B family protein [Duganella violaceipulchra]|uniref:asparagine synthase (glutamine-hydrolyzing) n=1 Tax=Duganella violaceipulchra TaxID=2849652 RepID=A0AA41L6B0_9BURK|nr:asparagine synthase-related protein [Duganella violaceicalia]MBV6325089.1 hypothetical protein [Duganella violaceicalia]MCP2010603.1 asparagine synthase (glutamine-hydrolyzing) [Duganella violaceicalia]
MKMENAGPWCWAGKGSAPSWAGPPASVWSGGPATVLRYTGGEAAELGDSWLVFSGAIHNRAALAQAGAQHQQTSDARRLLSLLDEFGIDALEQVNGMFAFVWWDARRRRLTAARDRFGIQTLYWHASNGSLTLGPRMAPLLDALGLSRRIDDDSAIDFLVNGFTDQDERTMFANVRQLPAATLLEWDPASGRTNLRNWYRLAAPGGNQLSEPEAVEQFRSLLADAVRLRSDARQRPALMLSAGIDSSLIAGLLAAHNPTEPMPTYKTYFDSAAHDLRSHVDAVLTKTRAVHGAAMISATDLFDHRDAILAALEQPYERSIVAAHWVLCQRMAEDGVTATLDGVGADEQLGGYRVFQSSLLAFQRGEKPPGLAMVGASRPPQVLEPDANLDALYAWLPSDIRAAAARRIRAETDQGIDSFGQMCRHHMQQGALPMLLRFNRDVGRAFGQVSMSPFMDHRLVEYSIGLNDGMKYSGGRSKYILRRAAAGLVPEAIIHHDNKTSYLDIEVAWLGGPGLARLREGVRQAIGSLPRLLSPAVPEGPLDKYTILRMWRIDCLGAWARLYSAQG